jgi:hypothetical protein
MPVAGHTVHLHNKCSSYCQCDEYYAGYMLSVPVGCFVLLRAVDQGAQLGASGRRVLQGACKGCAEGMCGVRLAQTWVSQSAARGSCSCAQGRQ